MGEGESLFWEGGGWEERVDPCLGTFGADLVEFLGRGMPGSAMQGSLLPLDQHPGVLPVTSAHRGDPGQLQVSQPLCQELSGCSPAFPAP